MEEVISLEHEIMTALPRADAAAEWLSFLSTLDAAAPAARTLHLFQHLRLDVQGVADENRLHELPFLDAHESQGAHGREHEPHAAAHGQDQQAVRERSDAALRTEPGKPVTW